MQVYIDTSALAKWYVNEANSEAFADWIRQQNDACISSLTVTEMRCLLARRQRTGDFSKDVEQEIFAAFSDDIQLGHIFLRPLKDEHAAMATHLVDQLPQLPLRTLDALHLAIARALACKHIATADRVMAEAAEALHMKAVRFD